MPGWCPGLMNARSWNGCAATSADARCPRSGWRSRRRATFDTSSRRRTGTAPHMWFYSGHSALRPWCQPSVVQNRSRRFCRAAGVHCPPGGAGAQTEGQPDPFHGVFALNSKPRALVSPAKRGRGNRAKVSSEPPTPGERRASC